MEGGEQPALQPLLSARSASFCSAQLRSVKPQIIHSLGYETEEEGEERRDGGREQQRETRGAPHSPARTNCQLSVSLSSPGRTHSLLLAQFGYRISRRGEDPHLCFISVFKFESNICLTFSPTLCLQLFLLLFSFFFLCP